MTSRNQTWCLLAAVFVLSISASATTLTLGSAANYALFVGPYMNSFNMAGNTTIYGDIAIGQNSSYNWAGTFTDHGNLFDAPGVTGLTSGTVSITGTTTTNASLGTAVSNAQTAATTAAGLAATTSVSGNIISLNSANQTITATGTQTVLDVSAIVINDGNLTLSGTSNDIFVVNITGSNGIAMSGSANILLSGGLTASDVLFNVEASGGNAISIAGAEVINGTILALNTNVELSGTQTLNGALISGFGSSSVHDVLQESGAMVINYDGFEMGGTPVPEPGTITLFALGAGALIARRRKMDSKPE